MKRSAIIGAHYYPGWHSCPVRDATQTQTTNEWDLVVDCRPRFERHEQPNVPLWGCLDDSRPDSFTKKITAATRFGIDVFVFAFYWSRRKQLMQRALNEGFLDCADNEHMRFALMWANRMPRRVLPVKDPQAQLINPQRLVYTDPDDFLEFVQYVAKKYFVRPNYFCYLDASYLSIFDTNFFLRQMGNVEAARAIGMARRWLRKEGFGALHLAAIDPTAEYQAVLKDIGFDSVTHYVFLPEWKGPLLQDYSQEAKKRAADWTLYPQSTGLPYFPSVSPGWDASPRAADFGKEKPHRYPWSPVVIGRSPQAFQRVMRSAIMYSESSGVHLPMCFIASWNEWSEGHYLEPDERYGHGWLESIKEARGGS